MAMYEGNWTCSSCGGAITQLPFEPRSSSGLTCRTCYAKRKEVDTADQTTASVAPQSAPAAQDMPDYADTQLADEPPLEDAFIGLEGLEAAASSSNTDGTDSTTKLKHEGDWSCALCGSSITSLPFEPRSTNNLKCLDCFKASKG